VVFLFIFSFCFCCFGQEEEIKGRDILFAQKGLPYGFEAALPEIHGFLSFQYWNAQDHVQGNYANSGSSSYNPGENTFLPHSFYVDIISELTPQVFIEGEFEMYKGEKGEFKVGAGRLVWHPSERFILSLGRQFILLGSQELVYYPTSKYRLMTWQPYIYEKFLRFTGWWDSGVCATGRIPVGENGAFLEYGVMVSNGPGDYSTSRNTMNSSGYVYEMFNAHNRQSYDNNDDKPVTWRVGFSPFEGLLVRVEGMQGKYDEEDSKDFNYLTSEVFFSRGKFDGMFGFAQLKFDASADTGSGIWPGGTVKQRSFYIVGGYKVIEKARGINFLQLVFRYQWFDPNVDCPSSVGQYAHYGKRQAFEIGLNYSPWEHTMFRVGYRFQDELKGPDLKGDGLTFEVVADF
jgi:hypothetical protein